MTLQVADDCVEAATNLLPFYGNYDPATSSIKASDVFTGIKREIFDHYLMFIELGVELPDNLKTDEGEHFSSETLPYNLVSKYFRDVVYPALHEFQQ